MRNKNDLREKILLILAQKGQVRMVDLKGRFVFSRQYLSRVLKSLVEEGLLVKLGGTRLAHYVSPSYVAKDLSRDTHFIKLYKNKGLEEHLVLDEIADRMPSLKKLPDNVGSIFNYAFSEMFNNAIEHSKSETIRVEVVLRPENLEFTINDGGVGIFRNIMVKRKLESELEAVQDLLKGKVTTLPKSHSGEGIFFTSKVADWFLLDSFGYQLSFDNTLPDLFLEKVNHQKRGTMVFFRLAVDSRRHLNDVFAKYTNLTKGNDYGFDKTTVKIKLYAMGGVHISRSQARRVLAGLEKFRIITFDFDQVPVVGQAFADEIFRVFHNKYPQIQLETENMREGVKFMVQRAINEAKK